MAIEWYARQIAVVQLVEETGPNGHSADHQETAQLESWSIDHSVC